MPMIVQAETTELRSPSSHTRGVEHLVALHARRRGQIQVNYSKERTRSKNLKTLRLFVLEDLLLKTEH